MEGNVLIGILAAAVTAGTPLLYAALGEIISERAGVLNLGVEGMMLTGAVTGFMVAVTTSNPWWGALAAILAGGAVALIHAVLAVTFQANQVVSGLALTIFGTGLSGYLGKAYIGVPAPKPFVKFEIPFLADIPFIGPILFNQDALVYCSYLLVPLVWFYVYKTKHGLNLRAIGENPGAADAVGINVFALRYLYVVVGGMLAGLAGAYLSLAYAPAWLENMTAGRGWIAVSLVIFATWNPLKAVGGAYLFGGVDALGYRLQAMGLDVSSFFLKMLPYIFTIIVLIFATTQTTKKHIAAPGALSLSYDREER